VVVAARRRGWRPGVRVAGPAGAIHRRGDRIRSCSPECGGGRDRSRGTEGHDALTAGALFSVRWKRADESGQVKNLLAETAKRLCTALRLRNTPHRRPPAGNLKV
jgi:hypothetical protein